jgi:xylulokinase
MAQPRTLLGLDLGTSALKATLIGPDGSRVAGWSVPSPFAPVPGGSPGTGVDALFASVHALLGSLSPWLPGVVGVGVAGLGESGGWVGTDGVADVPMLAWHDPYGQGTADRLVAAVGQEELVRRTGRRARSWTTLSKIGWLAEQGVRPAGRWTGAAGLVVWLLTGAVAQEPSLAATSGAFDPTTGRYDDDLLALVGVSVDWAPVVRAGTRVGTVTPAAAASTGLPVGVPVTIAGHDHPVSVVGAGARPEMVTDSMGTGEPLLVGWEATRPAPPLDDLPGHLTLTGWPGRSALMLLWEHLRPGRGLARLAELLERPREELEILAADRPEGRPLDAAALLGLEDGVLGPDDLPTGLVDDPGQAWADALDGYAEQAAAGEQRLRRLSGADQPTLLTGGGTRSPRWVRAKRDRSTHGLLVVDDAESVARGAALLAGVAAGCWPADRLPAATLDARA